MMLIVMYLVTLLLVCSYAYWNGSVTEKQGAGIMVAGSVLTPLFATGWQQLDIGVLIVDVAVLVALTALMLRRDKYWLLWATAFQIIAVLTHIARLIDPVILPSAYAIAGGFWAYPMLVALALGVNRSRGQISV